MQKRKILLLILIFIVILVLIYVVRMLAPLLQDVWKILVVGVIIGFIPGWWGGIKWKEISMDVEKDYDEHEKREKKIQ